MLGIHKQYHGGDKATGKCVSTPIAGCGVQCLDDADCDDANKRTADSCNQSNKTCVHVNLPGCTP